MINISTDAKLTDNNMLGTAQWGGGGGGELTKCRVRMYVIYHNPKMHPFNKFGIPVSNDIRDMLLENR